eukprot:Rhum_TRINITY_DN14991_c1_g1::Rhum_TRINITY_DN14991_c1_g1_i1::g.130770::m.130770
MMLSAAVVLGVILLPPASGSILSFTGSGTGHDCSYQCSVIVSAAQGQPYVCDPQFYSTTAELMVGFANAGLSCPAALKVPAKTKSYEPSRNDATGSCSGYDYQGGDTFDCDSWAFGHTRGCDCRKPASRGTIFPVGCTTELRTTGSSDDAAIRTWSYLNSPVGMLCVIAECPDAGDYHHFRVEVSLSDPADNVEVRYAEVLGREQSMVTYTGTFNSQWIPSNGGIVKYRINIANGAANTVVIQSRCAAGVFKTCADWTGTCPAGHIRRVYQANIRCGFDAALCTAAMCCDATCESYACAGERRDDAATALCGSSADTCTTDRCCKIACDKFTCVAPYIARANPSAVTCGLTVGECTNAKCCDVACGGYTCATLGYVSDPAKSAFVCGPAVSSCTDAACCLATCASHTCPALWAAKATPAANIQCAGTCLDAECCDVTCAQYSCTGQYTAKAANPVCGNVLADCSDAQCCDVTCMAFSCPSGFLARPDPAMITCGAATADCTEAICCDVSCSHPGFTCTTPRPLVSMPGTVRCGTSLGDCTDNICCLFTCSTHACVGGSGFVDKAGKDAVVCGTSAPDCDDTKCCDVTCAHTGFTCTAPAAKAGASTCGALVTDCTAATCCEVKCSAYSCPAGFAAKTPDPTCGSAVADCTTAICCDATCDNAGFTCATGVLRTN